MGIENTLMTLYNRHINDTYMYMYIRYIVSRVYNITREYRTAILTVYNNSSESHMLGMQLNITTRPHSWVLIGTRPNNLVIYQDIVAPWQVSFSLGFYEFFPISYFRKSAT